MCPRPVLHAESRPSVTCPPQVCAEIRAQFPETLPVVMVQHTPNQRPHARPRARTKVEGGSRGLIHCSSIAEGGSRGSMHCRVALSCPSTQGAPRHCSSPAAAPRPSPPRHVPWVPCHVPFVTSLLSRPVCVSSLVSCVAAAPHRKPATNGLAAMAA